MTHKFKIGDEVLVVTCHAEQYAERAKAIIGKVGKITAVYKFSKYSYTVALPGNPCSNWHWEESELDWPSFSPGSKAICDDQEYEVVGRDEDGKIRLQDEDGEFSRPESDLTEVI